jgi:hypothetical protein
MSINTDKCHFLGIENPRVGSSILPPATSKNKAHSDVSFFTPIDYFDM